MNLLTKYLPNYNGYLQSIEYKKEKGILTIIFCSNPEEFKPILKLLFKEVANFSSVQIDEHENNYTELAIGFDLNSDVYLLHTDIREITFNANSVEVVEIIT